MGRARMTLTEHDLQRAERLATRDAKEVVAFLRLKDVPNEIGIGILGLAVDMLLKRLPPDQRATTLRNFLDSFEEDQAP
jgi:hypothetical protein